MIACPLPVIPPKCTGVPITQPEKIILMYKSVFFFIFKKNKYIFVINKAIFNFNFNIKKLKKLKN
jgi:hypothetical protein